MATESSVRTVAHPLNDDIMLLKFFEGSWFTKKYILKKRKCGCRYFLRVINGHAHESVHERSKLVPCDGFC